MYKDESYPYIFYLYLIKLLIINNNIITAMK